MQITVVNIYRQTNISQGVPEFLVPLYNFMTTTFYTTLRQSEAEDSEFTAAAFLGITLNTLSSLYNFIKTQNFMFSGPILDWFSQHYKGGVWKKLFEKTVAPPTPPPPKEPQIIDSSDEDEDCDKSRVGGSRKQISTILKVSQLSTLV